MLLSTSCMVLSTTSQVKNVKNAGLRASFPAILRPKPEKENVLVTMQPVVVWGSESMSRTTAPWAANQTLFGFPVRFDLGNIVDHEPAPAPPSQDRVAMLGSLLVLVFIFSDPLPFKKQIYLFLSCMYVCTACTPTPREVREIRELH